MALKRNNGRTEFSLDSRTRDGEVEKDLLKDVIVAEDGVRRLQTVIRSGEETADLRNDVRSVISDLPPEERALCQHLMTESVSTVARLMGIPRTTLQGSLRRLRQRFEDAGLREYV